MQGGSFARAFRARRRVHGSPVTNHLRSSPYFAIPRRQQQDQAATLALTLALSSPHA